MHIGNWIALALLVLVGAIIVRAAILARRRRLSAPPKVHGPTPMGDPAHDEATLIRIGTTAADSARSASG